MAAHNDPVRLGGAQSLFYPLPLSHSSGEGGGACRRQAAEQGVGEAGQQYGINHHQLQRAVSASDGEHLQPVEWSESEAGSGQQRPYLRVVELWHVPARGQLGVRHLRRGIAIVIVIAAQHVPARLQSFGCEYFLHIREGN